MLSFPLMLSCFHHCACQVLLTNCNSLRADTGRPAARSARHTAGEAPDAFLCAAARLHGWLSARLWRSCRRRSARRLTQPQARTVGSHSSKGRKPTSALDHVQYKALFCLNVLHQPQLRTHPKQPPKARFVRNMDILWTNLTDVGQRPIPKQDGSIFCWVTHKGC
jgi:hypothetical protein